MILVGNADYGWRFTKIVIFVWNPLNLFVTNAISIAKNKFTQNVLSKSH